MTDTFILLRDDRTPDTIAATFDTVELALDSAKALVENGIDSTICWGEKGICTPIIHFRWLGGGRFEMDDILAGCKRTKTVRLN